MTYDPDKDICEGKHGGSKTSIAAFEKLEKSGRRMSKRVLCHKFVIDSGVEGKTADEASNELHMLPNTASARFSELKAFGSIYETKKQRNTKGGKSPAFVCVDMDIGLKNKIEPNDDPNSPYAAQHAAIAERIKKGI